MVYSNEGYFRRWSRAVVVVAATRFPAAPALHTPSLLISHIQTENTRLLSPVHRLPQQGITSQNEYAHFAADFTALSTVLVLQLDRLARRLVLAEGSSISSTKEHDMFWEL